MPTAVSARFTAAITARGRQVARSFTPELAVLLLVVLGAGLRLWNLEGLGDFDFDEVAAVWYARAGLLDIVADIARAPFEHPPLYYMALHVWISWFGEAEPIVRAFSIPFGVLLIPATYRLARCYVASWPAVIAAVLVTASPLLIFFSREARMYAPAALFAVLALWLFERAMRSGRRRDWAGVGVCVAAGSYIDFTVAIAVAAMVLALPWHWRRRRRRVLIFVGVGVVSMAILLPWLILARGLHDSLPAFGTGDLGPGVLTEIGRTAWLDLLVGVEEVRSGRLSTAYAIGAAVLVAGGIGVAVVRRRGGLMLGYVAAVAGFLVLLLVFDKPYQPRYLLPAIPAIGVLVAVAFDAVPRVPLRGLAAAAVAVALLAGPVAGSRAYFTDYVRGDYRSITTTIENLARPQRPGRDDGKFRDAVVLAGPWQGWFWRHYYPNFLDKVDVWLLPAEVPPAVDALEVDSKLAHVARNHRRVWVVLAGLEQADPEGLTEAWLTTYLWQARSEVYRNGVLQLYMTHVLDFVRRKGPVNINDEFVTSKLWFGGYRADQGPREAADGVRFSIQLAAQASVDYDLQIRIWVDGPGGVVYAKEIFAHDRARRRTSAWSPGDIHEIRTALWIPPEAPPGEYQTHIAFIGPDGDWLPISGELDHIPIVGPDFMTIGRLVIVPPSLDGRDEAA